MKLSPAPQTNVQALVEQLTQQKLLSPDSLQRLQTLTSLIDEQGYVNYTQAYNRLFPNSSKNASEKTKADKAFSKFRTTLRTITTEHGLPLTLQVDNNKQADNNRRHLWFECDDNLEQRLQAYSASVTQQLPENLQEQSVSVGNGRLNYLLVYAKDEQAHALKLQAKLNIGLQAADKNWRMFDYHDIPVGDEPKQTRSKYRREADFTLLMLSPALIAQLKTGLIEPDLKPPLIPLALKTVSQDQLKNTALENCQYFTDQDGKAWTTLKGKQEEWENLACRQIIIAVSNPKLSVVEQLENCRLNFDHASGKHYIPQPIDTGKEAIPYLLDWLSEQKNEVFCAIFGELGMGKTTLCQRLTQELLAQRTTRPNLPFPVYFDLRSVNTLNWHWQDGVPGLEVMIKHVLSSSYNQPVDSLSIDINDIKQLAQQHGGLIIFDGLDEIMNRLTPDQSNLFIQQLWNILPPAVWNNKDQADKKHGRLIMTCRSHYFQTLQDQLNALTGQQREAVQKKHYSWVNLLPLNDSQVEAYFRQVFAAQPEQAERIIAMLDQVHNLRELSNRPYNMRLIQDQVEYLEALHRQDKKVSVADLYEGMVNLWLQRDKPKHRLNLDHKLLLMENLALWLWRGNKKQLNYTDLEDWLTDRLAENPRWQLTYQAYIQREQGIDILQQDLRNASFLVRADDDSFRFAHTSIMEFFLARALYRALLDKQAERWAIPLPSVETLDFLGDLIARAGSESCLQTMAAIRRRYQAQTSELLLNYALRAYHKGYPGAVFNGFDLSTAKLKDLRIKAEPHKPLNWQQADFTGADLSNSEFTGVNFNQSRFDRALLDRCLFDGCGLEQSTGLGASLVGTVFHHCLADQADFSGAVLNRTQWLPNPLLSASELVPIKGLQQPPPLMLAGFSHKAGEKCRKQSFVGHNRSVNSVAFDPGTLLLASASSDHTIKLWHPESGECLLTLSGHEGGVNSVAFESSTRLLASGSNDKTIKLWDTDTGECLHTLASHEGGVSSVAFYHNTRLLASGSGDKSIKLWNTNTGACLHTLAGHSDIVTSVAFDLNARLLASGGIDSTKLWHPDTGECLHTLAGDSGGVNDIAFEPHTQLLASGGIGGSIKLWNPDTGACLHTLAVHSDMVFSVAFDLNARLLASGGIDSTIKLWNLESGDCLLTLAGHNSWILSVAFDPNTRLLASGCFDNSIKLWNPDTGDCLHTLAGHSDRIISVDFAPNTRLLASGSHDHTIKLWDPDTGECLLSLAGHSGGVNSVAFDPRTRLLASASDDHTIKLWIPDTGECLHTLAGHSGGVNSVAFAPNTRLLASGSDDKTIKLWNPNSGHCLHTLAGHSDAVISVAFDPNTRLLASASWDSTIKLWCLDTGDCLLTLAGHSGRVTSVAFAPNTRLLASASDNTIKLWHPDTGDCLHTLAGHSDQISSMAFDPNTRLLASASWDSTIKLWNPDTGDCLLTLAGHSGRVTSVAFDPNTRLLASGSFDNTIIFWDTGLADCPAVLKMEMLPEGNWVSWINPNQARQHWQRYSKDAWRWLGWNAPSPDGKTITRYPMDYFADAED